MEGRTILVIAHRLSTVRNADEILVMPGLVLVLVTLVVLMLMLMAVVQVMREGQVVERGSHLHLLELGGVYRRLVSKQMDQGMERS